MTVSSYVAGSTKYQSLGTSFRLGTLKLLRHTLLNKVTDDGVKGVLLLDGSQEKKNIKRRA